MLILTLPMKKTWSDEARAASAEARRAKEKVKPSGGARTPGVKARGEEAAKHLVTQWTQQYSAGSAEDLARDAAENQPALLAAAQKVREGTSAEIINNGAKKLARIKQKIERGKDPHTITDAARIGFNVRTPDEADHITDELGKHFEVADEGWRSVKGGYFDRTLKVKFPNGQTGEVQFYPPGLFAAKKVGHKMYEEYQQATTTPERKDELVAQMTRLYNQPRESLPPQWRRVIQH